jgi:hypothetical protein
MSEFQYYEFQALDRALSAGEQAELRRFSSRAKIHSRSFTNEYHWGDFKGNPVEWMKRYFDAHLYLSNFGCRSLHLRLPITLVEREAVRPYELDDVLGVHTTDSHLIYSLQSNEEPGRDYDGFDEDPSGVMSMLLPVRDLLALGDLRPLYLGWLVGVQNGLVDDDVQEPGVPAGLKQMTGVLQDLADFLWLDPELVEVAARRSGEVEETHMNQQIQPWIAGLASEEKDRWLYRFLSEEGPAAAQEFRRAFTTSVKAVVANAATGGLRTVGELVSEAEALREERREAAKRKAAEEKAAREKKAHEARLVHLRSLEGRESKIWASVIILTDASSQKSYDLAICELTDLRDLASITGKTSEFLLKLADLRELRRRKPSLIARLDKAGLLLA